MIGQLRVQIEADRGWMSQETANQADLSRQGLGNDARARDGRRLMQTMREKQRLDEAYLRVLECHATAGVSASNTPSRALVPQTERAPATTQGSTSLENAARQLEEVARATRDRALQNADPEVIAFYAKQDALAAQRDANVAAAMAGQARGQRDGRNGALKDQVEMVTKVVKSWQPPRGYTNQSTASGVVLEDPFASPGPAGPDHSLLRSGLEGTGLVWDDSRQLARVAVGANAVCGGRLQPGDYPVMNDGAPLDGPERIKSFLSTCSDSSQPLLVLRGEGELVVIK